MSIWSDLNNEGVRLAAEGDLAAARDKLAAALAAVPPEDRAQSLLNLAQVVDLIGERQHAVDLLTEALALAEGARRREDVGSRPANAERSEAMSLSGPPASGLTSTEAHVRGTSPGVSARRREDVGSRPANAERSEAMSLVVAARADILPWLDRWDEAWRDVEAALADAEPAQQVALRHSRVGLLTMAGRLADAEQEATATVALAARHAPGYLSNLYASLALLAEEAGNKHRAATYRLLGDNPAGIDEAGAMRWSTEAITAARTALELVGDLHSTAATLVNALVSRASTHLAHTRLTEALEDLDEALTVDGAHATARAVRARVLAIGGRYAEAAQEAQTALDLAYANEPALAATVHMTLAEITSGTGDLPGAVEHLAVARDLCAATGDVAGEATAVLSSARLAYLASDGETADALYDEVALLTNDPLQLAACLVGRAAVAVLRGKPADAVELVDRAQATLGPAATRLALVAVHQVRGSAYEAAGDFAAAETCYADAAAGCSAAGLWHVALGMAWWRADALVRRAAAVTGDERRAIAERALDLALPAALAAEAVRQRFPHGRLRERWVALASAPAIRSAFLAIRAVEDVELAAAYIDHLAAAVSFEAGSALPVAREDLVSLPEPPVAEPHLPPRVRVDPTVPSTLDRWLDVTEERYGFPVRSAQAVASW